MPRRSPSLSKQALSDTLSRVAIQADVTLHQADALHQAAADAKRAAERLAMPIAELGDMVTPTEVRNARRTRAVRQGKDVFLPVWQELYTAMPNLLLRSALWSVRSAKDVREEAERPATETDDRSEASVVPSMANAVIINRGPGLGAFDRRVFAACLDYYRDERPLSPDGSHAVVEVSFYKFITGHGGSYHLDSHRALRSSLERLAAMSLHVNHAGLELQLPRILEVSFADGKARRDKPLASDLIFFQINERFASLYGNSKWTAVSHDALNAGIGLKSWLACFYSTHSKPFETKLEDLHLLSGSTAPFRKFKAQLRQALEAMSTDSQPLSVRVKSYEMRASTLTVQMAAWRST